MTVPDPVVIAEVTAQYRATLLKLQEKMQAQYDKTVLSLSGGAFGVSVLIVKELVGMKSPVDFALVTFAWIFWGVSVLAVLLSFFSSEHAMKTAIRNIDTNAQIGPNIGGESDRWTHVFNVLSGACFIVGLGFFIYFVATKLSP